MLRPGRAGTRQSVTIAAGLSREGMCVLRHGCSLLSLLCWLPFAAAVGVFIYFAVGSIAVYVEMFGDISITQNTTVAVERVMSLVRVAYETHEMPHAFLLWGGLAVGAYIVVVLIYLLISLGCIARDCSRDCSDCAPASRRRLGEEEEEEEMATVDPYANYSKDSARL